MNEVQPGLPGVTPPVAPPAVAPAPANPTVSVETPATPPVAAPAGTPPAASAPPPEQLLTPVPPKPTLEALKLPKEHFVPKDEFDGILSGSKTVEEAQANFDKINGIYTRGIQRLEAQNQTWLNELKGDPEVGGAKWDETKSLYNSGVRRLFGDSFAERIRAAKLDAMPEFVKGVVKAEMAATPKPIVNVPPTPPPPAQRQMHEVVYGPDKTYNPQNPAQPLSVPRF